MADIKKNKNKEAADVVVSHVCFCNGGTLSKITHSKMCKNRGCRSCFAFFIILERWREHELLSSMCVINLRLNKTSLRIMKPSVMTV